MNFREEFLKANENKQVKYYSWSYYVTITGNKDLNFFEVKNEDGSLSYVSYAGFLNKEEDTKKWSSR